MYRSLNTEYLGIETDVETTVRLAQEGGFRGVDLSPKQTLEIQRDGLAEEIRAIFAKSNLLPGYFTPTPRNFSVSDSDWERDIERLPDLCASMSAVGFQRTLIVMLPFDLSLDCNANFARHKQRVRQMAEILQPFDIRVGLEYIASLTRRKEFRHHFVHDLAGALSLREAVDRPNVGIFLDCFHWYCARESESDILSLDSSCVVGAHINDAVAGRSIDEQMAFERELPGATGLIDLQTFLGALKKIGYDGPVTCEPLCEELRRLSPREAVRRTAEAMDAFL